MPADWSDITGDLGEYENPITLAKADGAGALQFSFAMFKRGVSPHPRVEDLRAMVLEFGEAHELGEPFDERLLERNPMIAALSFHSAGDFIRAWYVADGLNFALATYTCQAGFESSELRDCELIVESIRFLRTPDAGGQSEPPEQHC